MRIGTAECIEVMKEFEVGDEIYKNFENEAEVQVLRFERTPKLSTYLYSLHAGPFHVWENKENPGVPLRIFCRKSLVEHIEPFIQEHFDVTLKGIKFYSYFFSREYPFSKLDQLFVAEFNSGAMENVGAITYTESYIPRGQKLTQPQKERYINTILHELCHMWFGNLVTMDWWEDLWLNESFANFMAYLNQAENEGFNYQYVWSTFLDERTWAIIEDSLNSTHPIAGKAKDTDEAESLFDGISYGKGACWLKQLLYMYGHEAVKAGLKEYFYKFEFKNAALKDFLTCISNGAKAHGIERDLISWSESWLSTSGINIVEPKFEIKEGRISNFDLHQSLAKSGNNVLREQKFCVALFNAEMEVYFKKDVILLAQEVTHL